MLMPGVCPEEVGWAQLELTDASYMKISSQVSLDQIGITMWGSHAASTAGLLRAQR